MCEYCRKFTESACSLKEGYDVTLGYEGDAFIDFFNSLIIHLEGKDSIEVNIPIKYCPWCGAKLKSQVFKYANQDVLQDISMPAT